MADIERYTIDGQPRYRIHSDYAKDSLALTPQEMTELFDWLLLHMAEIERERDAQTPRIPPGQPLKPKVLIVERQDEAQKIVEYNLRMDQRDRIIRESVEKPWLPLHDGE